MKVYTKPQCVQCDATKRYLDKYGIEYEPIDITTEPGAYEFIVGLGALAAPVVVVGETWWSGYRPDMLNQFAEF